MGFKGLANAPEGGLNNVVRQTTLVVLAALLPGLFGVQGMLTLEISQG